MMLSALTYTQYKAMRDDLRPFIDAAVSHSDLTRKLVEKRLRRFEYVPLVFTEADKLLGMMVLELDTDALHIVTIAGDLPRGWQHETYNVLRRLAVDQGKSHLQLRGRKGWRRMLKPLGFKPHDEYLRAQI